MKYLPYLACLTLFLLSACDGTQPTFESIELEVPNASFEKFDRGQTEQPEGWEFTQTTVPRNEELAPRGHISQENAWSGQKAAKVELPPLPPDANIQVQLASWRQTFDVDTEALAGKNLKLQVKIKVENLVNASANIRIKTLGEDNRLQIFKSTEGSSIRIEGNSDWRVYSVFLGRAPVDIQQLNILLEVVGGGPHTGRLFQYEAPGTGTVYFDKVQVTVH